MRIVICDDELDIVKAIGALTNQYLDDKRVEADCYEIINPRDIFSLQPDILFLDIEMPEMSGISVKEQLEVGGEDIMIVFITNYLDAMPKAFGKNVIGFLTKPVDREQFELLLDKAVTLSFNHRIVTLEDNTSISCEKIQHIKVSGNYTDIYTVERLIVNQRKTLKEWMKDLETVGFIRISDKFVVNCRHIREFGNNNSLVFLDSGTQLEVSKRRKAQCQAKYMEYCRKMARYV